MSLSEGTFSAHQGSVIDQLVSRPKATQPPAAAAPDLEPLALPRRRRRLWPYLVAAAIVGGAAALIAWGGPAAEPPTYQTSPAEIGDLTVEVSATGTLQPLTQVDISSDFRASSARSPSTRTDIVRKGDVLAVLDTTRLAAQVERAEASVKAAEAKVDDARTTLAGKSERALLARRRSCPAAAWSPTRRWRRRGGARPRAERRGDGRGQPRHRRGRAEAAAGRPRKEHASMRRSTASC